MRGSQIPCLGCRRATDGIVGSEILAFNGLEYIASYPDLMAAFGPNKAAGEAHYLNFGRFEGRTVTFDALEYIASYADLRAALGANEDAGASHYITNGRFENRVSNFDGLQYI